MNYELINKHMENNEQLPEKEKVVKTEETDDLPPVVDPGPDQTCPTGYYYDAQTDKCILDVG